MKSSWAGVLFSAASAFAFYKRIYSNEKWLGWYISYREKVNDRPQRPGFWGGRKRGIEQQIKQGMEIFIRNAPGSEGQTTVLYLHGSGYVMQPTVFHWRFFERMARELQAEVVMPIYPKAPSHHFAEALEKLTAFYQELTERKQTSKIVLVGDSSGGAVALALAQEAARQHLPAPERLILISPLLDSSLRRPEIPEIEKIDLLQTRKVLRAFGEAWAGDEKLTQPGVSRWVRCLQLRYL